MSSKTVPDNLNHPSSVSNTTTQSGETSAPPVPSASSSSSALPSAPVPVSLSNAGRITTAPLAAAPVTKSVPLLAVAQNKTQVSSGTVAAVLSRTTGTLTRIANPQALAATGTMAVRPGVTAKILNLTGATLPPGYRLSPLTLNFAGTANGKGGVVPVVLSGTAASYLQGSTSGHDGTAGQHAVLKRIRPDGEGMISGRTSATVFNGPARVSLTSQSSFDAVNAANKRRRRTTEDGVKGLRYFATKVCDKVKEKNLTSYNAVAEELVLEYSDPSPTKSREELACEQKNIRRRVYDALNVLMAINVIQKERKQIRWVGLPRSLSEAGVLKRDTLTERRKALGHLRQRLFQSALQFIALKELVEDNKTVRAEKLGRLKQTKMGTKMQGGAAAVVPPPDLLECDESQHIELPFLFLTCNNQCDIECSVASDAKDYEMQFSEPFKIMEDTEVLRHIPLARLVEKGTPELSQMQKAIGYLPPFVQARFPGLLSEHKDRTRKMEETKRQEQQARLLAAADRARREREHKMMETVLKSKAPIAPAPLAPPLIVPTVKENEAMETEVEPVGLAVAAVYSGSPVVKKSGYYLEIGQTVGDLRSDGEQAMIVSGHDLVASASGEESML